MKTISKPLALTAAIALSLSAPALAALPKAVATGDAFTVLSLEQAPERIDATVLADQLQALQVDALTIGNVVRAADAGPAADPLQVLADRLGYSYRFVTGAADAAERRGSIVISRLPVEAELDSVSGDLNYLRLNDGAHVVALYTRSVGAASGAAPVKNLVDATRLGAPAVLLGAVDAEGATAAGFDSAATGSYFSQGFESATSTSVKLRTDTGKQGVAGTLLTLGYAAPVGGEPERRRSRGAARRADDRR